MRPRHVALGCGAVLLVLFLAAGCGLSWIYSELPAGEHPEVDFQAEEISQARAAKIPLLETELDEVEARFGAPHVGPSARVDRCEPGQDNFTRQDTYAYSCRMTVYTVMPVADPARDSLSRLGEALLDGTCPEGTDTDRRLRERGGDPGSLIWNSGDCRPGLSEGGPRIVTVVPVPLRPGDAGSVSAYGVRCSPYVSPGRGRCKAEHLDLRRAAAAAPPGTTWLAVVAAEDTYYLVPWECSWPASWFRESCGGEPQVR